MLKFPLYLDFGLHFVCLSCRRSMKRRAPYIWNKDAAPMQPKMVMEKVVCPECHGRMICCGKKFTPPPRRDLKQWKKLEWLIENGSDFYSWPTTPKMTLRQTQESLATRARSNRKVARKRKEDESLLERRRAAKYNSSRSKTAKKRLRADLKRQEEYQKAVLEAIANRVS